MDIILLQIIEAILVIVFIIALINDIKSYIKQNWVKKKGLSANATVIRGKQSMNYLIIFYGATTSAYLAAIQMTRDYDDHKITLFVLNICLLTYLFYFSSWFRNSLLFPFIGRIQQD